MPLRSQRYAKASGGLPVQVPLVHASVLPTLPVPETFGRTWFDGSALKTAIWLWGNRSSVVKVPPTTTPPAPSTASLAALKLLTFGFQGMTVPVASKQPPMYTFEPDTASANALSVRFGSQLGSTVPFVVSTAAA